MGLSKAKVNDQMSHVFISYISEDIDTVNRLVTEIRSHGIDVWLDRERIKPGQRWKLAIRSAIYDGAFFIACFSQAYEKKAKSYMNEELLLAIEELRLRPLDRVWFIPVRLSDCEVPAHDIGAGETLKSLQWVDLFKDWNTEVNKILAALSKIQYPEPRVATRIGDLSKIERSLLYRVHWGANYYNEESFIAEYGLSKEVVRDALNRLALSGLVTIKNDGSVEVTEEGIYWGQELDN